MANSNADKPGPRVWTNHRRAAAHTSPRHGSLDHRCGPCPHPLGPDRLQHPERSQSETMPFLCSEMPMAPLSLG